MYAPIFYRDLAARARDYQRQHGRQAGIKQFGQHLREAFEAKQLNAQEFSLQACAEYTVPDGREWVRSMNPRLGGVMEAVDAVDTSAFSNIIGQLVINKVLEGYMSEAFDFTNGVTTIDTKFSGEKIPGIGGIGDEAEQIGEGNPYPTVGLNEDWIETPVTTKHGFIIPVTKEAIFFDRTNLVLQLAGEVGEYLGLHKEKEIINAFIDANTTAYRYKWKGTTYGSYQGSTPWVNLKATNGLYDWVNVQAAELLLANMLDPSTGQPILVDADCIVVPPALLHTARQIVNATQVRKVDLASGGASTTVSIGANPLSADPLSGSAYKIIASRIYRFQANKASAGTCDTNWYLTNLKKTIGYMQNWPITVVQAPQNSEAEFVNDIVVRFKASEAAARPCSILRYTVQNTQ